MAASGWVPPPASSGTRFRPSTATTVPITSTFSSALTASHAALGPNIRVMPCFGFIREKFGFSDFPLG